MKTFKEILEGSHFVSSADYVITPSGNKVHKYKKIASTDYKDKEEPKDPEQVAQDIESDIQARRQARRDRMDRDMKNASARVRNEETILDEATEVEHGH